MWKAVAVFKLIMVESTHCTLVFKQPWSQEHQWYRCPKNFTPKSIFFTGVKQYTFHWLISNDIALYSLITRSPFDYDYMHQLWNYVYYISTKIDKYSEKFWHGCAARVFATTPLAMGTDGQNRTLGYGKWVKIKPLTIGNITKSTTFEAVLHEIGQIWPKLCHLLKKNWWN